MLAVLELEPAVSDFVSVSRVDKGLEGKFLNVLTCMHRLEERHYRSLLELER